MLPSLLVLGSSWHYSCSYRGALSHSMSSLRAGVGLIHFHQPSTALQRACYYVDIRLVLVSEQMNNE